MQQAQAWAAGSGGPNATPVLGTPQSPATAASSTGLHRPPSPLGSPAPAQKTVDLSGPKLRQLLGLPKKPPWQQEEDKRGKEARPQVAWRVDDDGSSSDSSVASMSGSGSDFDSYNTLESGAWHGCGGTGGCKDVRQLIVTTAHSLRACLCAGTFTFDEATIARGVKLAEEKEAKTKAKAERAAARARAKAEAAAAAEAEANGKRLGGRGRATRGGRGGASRRRRSPGTGTGTAGRRRRSGTGVGRSLSPLMTPGTRLTATGGARVSPGGGTTAGRPVLAAGDAPAARQPLMASPLWSTQGSPMRGGTDYNTLIRFDRTGNPDHDDYAAAASAYASAYAEVAGTVDKLDRDARDRAAAQPFLMLLSEAWHGRADMGWRPAWWHVQRFDFPGEDGDGGDSASGLRSGDASRRTSGTFYTGDGSESSVGGSVVHVDDTW